MVIKLKPNKITFHGLLLAMTLLLVINLMVLPVHLSAQELPNPAKTDSLTYSLYLEKQWDDLIAEGEKALKNGVDFYYLQIRMAIAWYEKHNYRKAIPYFENALEYDRNNQFALEYLYFAYLLSGREYDARRINSRISDEGRPLNKIPKNKFLHQFYFEGAYGIAGNQSLGSKRGRQNQSDSIYSETWKYDQLGYFHAGARFDIFPKLNLYLGYNRLSSNFRQEVSYLKQPLEDFEDKVKQDELYGNFEIAPFSGLKITPAWHYCRADYSERNILYDSVNYTLDSDTVFWQKENLTLFLSIRKDISNFAVEAFGNYSDFELKILKQAGLAIYWYPMGNIDFYTKTSLEYVWNDEDNYYVFNQLAGFKLSGTTWLEAEFTYGTLRDYAEKNAYVIYNASEEINFKGEAILLHNLSKHLDVSLRYRYMQRENQLLTFSDGNTSSILTTTYPYHTLIAGLTWRL